MSVITLPGLIHALNNRRPGAVKDEATRNMVIRFQRWVNHELVPTVMRTGRYEVQRPQHLLEAAHHERMMQVELLKASQGIVHPDFLEAKTRIVIARELGELPELDPKTRPLYTQDYLREKNLKRPSSCDRRVAHSARSSRPHIESETVETHNALI